MAQMVKNLPANTGDGGLFPVSVRAPGVGNANQSSTFAQRAPWTRSMVDYSPRGHKELDTTEQLTVTFPCHGTVLGNTNLLKQVFSERC